MPRKDFFESQTPGSEIKTEIVRKYFLPWARIMARNVKQRGQTMIAYVDLFAGPGRYRDGSKSTPILILEQAIKEKPIGQMLYCLFNDAEKKNADALRKEIASIADIASLKYQPKVVNDKVDDRLAARFEEISTVPTLYFLDPFGYNGLSLRLIKAVLRPFGCDCIFFFNYKRINAALSNSTFTENMNSFFGKERADGLRGKLTGKTPEQREELIISELKRALKDLGGKFAVDYCFKDASGHRTSHHLILTSKNPKAESIMKEIMARESSTITKGVASFGYNPLDELKKNDPQRELFDAPDPIEELAVMLMEAFEGRTLRVSAICDLHGPGRRYTTRNYKDAILKLEADGRVQTDPLPYERAQHGGKTTLGDGVKVTFPKRKGQK